MERRTVVVGDVHGCIDELEELLSICKLDELDSLVFVGDLVAKGPDSAAVVELAMRLDAQAVRGDHDQHCLNACALLAAGRGEEVEAARGRLAASLTDEATRWLASLPLSLRLPEHDALVVHGGFDPSRPPEGQPEKDLMNVRSIREDGTPSKRIEDGEPWASAWRGPELVIFGHDALRGLQRHPHAIGLDTGCVYGGQLSALILPTRELVQVAAHRVHFDPLAQPAKR